MEIYTIGAFYKTQYYRIAKDNREAIGVEHFGTLTEKNPETLKFAYWDEDQSTRATILIPKDKIAPYEDGFCLNTLHNGFVSQQVFLLA